VAGGVDDRAVREERMPYYSRRVSHLTILAAGRRT